jgi:hypothetical protein
VLLEKLMTDLMSSTSIAFTQKSFETKTLQRSIEMSQFRSRVHDESCLMLSTSNPDVGSPAVMEGEAADIILPLQLFGSSPGKQKK